MILRTKGSDIHLRVHVYEHLSDDRVELADLAQAEVATRVHNGYRDIRHTSAVAGSDVLVDVAGRDAAAGDYTVTLTITRGAHTDTLMLRPVKVVDGPIAASIDHKTDELDGIVELYRDGTAAAGGNVTIVTAAMLDRGCVTWEKLADDVQRRITAAAGGTEPDVDKAYVDGKVTLLQGRIDGAAEQAAEAAAQAANAMTVARGRATGHVFASKAEMDAHLAMPEFTAELKKGDNLYITATNVPDYWWDGTQAQELETQKVDLTEYATKAYAQQQAQSAAACVKSADWDTIEMEVTYEDDETVTYEILARVKEAGGDA